MGKELDWLKHCVPLSLGRDGRDIIERRPSVGDLIIAEVESPLMSGLCIMRVNEEDKLTNVTRWKFAREDYCGLE